MSYILDALKKSEQQRQVSQQQAGNTSWLEPEYTKPATSLIPGLLIGFVVATAVAVAFWLLMDVKWAQPVMPDESAVLNSELLDSELHGSEGATVSTDNADALISPPVPVASVEAKLIEEKSVEAIAVKETKVSTAEVVEVATEDPSVQRSRRQLPPLLSLRKVPDLIISGHIYSSAAEKRSVTMNGRDWSEGEYISEDIVLAEITPKGIRLEVDGWSLPVKRNRGWQAID